MGEKSIDLGVWCSSGSGDVNNKWDMIAGCIRKPATEVLGYREESLVVIKEIGGGMEKLKIKWKLRRLPI